MIVEQQKVLNESLREDKEFWRDIYSVLVERKKQFDELFNAANNFFSKLASKTCIFS